MATAPPPLLLTPVPLSCCPRAAACASPVRPWVRVCPRRAAEHTLQLDGAKPNGESGPLHPSDSDLLQLLCSRRLFENNLSEADRNLAEGLMGIALNLDINLGEIACFQPMNTACFPVFQGSSSSHQSCAARSFRPWPRFIRFTLIPFQSSCEKYCIFYFNFHLFTRNGADFYMRICVP